MSRSWTLFLEDMVEAARRIVQYTTACDQPTFASRGIVYDATLRNLIVLGEAAKKIPQHIRDRHPDVDWRDIAGLRDLASHAYFRLDDAALWKTVRTDVPALLAQLERIDLREEGGE